MDNDKMCEISCIEKYIKKHSELNKSLLFFYVVFVPIRIFDLEIPADIYTFHFSGKFLRLCKPDYISLKNNQSFKKS